MIKSLSPKVKTSQQSKSPSSSQQSKSPSSSSLSPKVKTSQKSKSPSSQSVLSKSNRTLFYGLENKFKEDIYERIINETFKDKHDWFFELMKETRKYPKNKLVTYVMEFKWRNNDLIYLLKYLTNKQKVSDVLYNEVILRLIVEIFAPCHACGEDSDDDEDDDEYQYKVYYHGVPMKVFTETTQRRIYYILDFCAKKRQFDTNTLNTILIHARNNQRDLHFHIRFIARLIKPDFYERFNFHGTIHILSFCLLQVVNWYDTKERKVYINIEYIDENKRDIVKYINLLLRKIYEITKVVALNGYKQFTNINSFKKSYFELVIDADPDESYVYPEMMKKKLIFMGNIEIRKLLQLINVKSRASPFTKKEISSMRYVFPSKLLKFDHNNAIKLEYVKFK